MKFLGNNIVFYSIFIVLIFFMGCGQIKNLFNHDSPHEKYLKMLEESGLNKTELGRAWKDSAESSLINATQIALPFKEEIYFFNDKVNAESFSFKGKKGELITIGVQHNSSSDKLIFADLFKVEDEPGHEYKRVASSDSMGIMQYEISDNSTYLLRLQPELLFGGRVTLTILTAPSLAFPVDGKDSHAIHSVFGDSRDGGARRHEGVDIFAKRGTPVKSASDGIVTRVNNTKIGGKVVWVYNISKGEDIYYAHLDSQLVSPGKLVKAGDTLGLVGNTGNARTTPTHLHFGIYIPGYGAVDPFPFIDNLKHEPGEVRLSSDLIGKYARVKNKNILIKSSLLKNSQTVISLTKSSPVEIIGAAGDNYFIRTPLGAKGFVKAAQLESIEKPLRTVQLNNPISIYDAPETTGTMISSISPLSTVEVYGKLGEYWFIKNNDYFGWVLNL